MNTTKSWKLIKRHGNTRRKIKNKYSKILLNHSNQCIRFKDPTNKIKIENGMGSVASQNSSVLSVKTNHGFEGGLIHSELIGEAFLGD